MFFCLRYLFCLYKYWSCSTKYTLYLNGYLFQSDKYSLHSNVYSFAELTTNKCVCTFLRGDDSTRLLFEIDKLSLLKPKNSILF